MGVFATLQGPAVDWFAISPLLVLLGFGIYYPFVIRFEGRRLAETHGEAYQVYQQTTPALLPKLGLFHESSEHCIHSGTFRRGVFDSIWFFVAFAWMHLFVELHHVGQILRRRRHAGVLLCRRNIHTFKQFIILTRCCEE